MPFAASPAAEESRVIRKLVHFCKYFAFATLSFQNGFSLVFFLRKASTHYLVLIVDVCVRFK